MRANYATNAAPMFGVLSEGQIEDVYLPALEVLEKTGTRVYHDEALALLSQAGCRISDGNLALFLRGEEARPGNCHSDEFLGLPGGGFTVAGVYPATVLSDIGYLQQVRVKTRLSHTLAKGRLMKPG